MNGPARARLARGAALLAARIAARVQPEACDCDVLVVGSGYGGAVAAARLAGAEPLQDAGRPGEAIRVWVLERGLEHPPGSFPARFGELPGEVRFSSGGRAPRGNAEGLFDLRLGDDVHVLLGNGLGGGSLINAGVMERPLPEIFANGWPQGLDLDEPRLQQAYARAEAMLGPGRLPESPDRPPPAKLSVLRGLAYGACGPVPSAHDLRCRVTVGHDNAPSAAGVAMAPCTRCGDCTTGCNQGAKGSLDTSYLAWARRAGAELFTGGWVQHLQRDAAAGCWIVHWHYTAGVLEPPPPLRAHRVVLAAGSLGSTAILQRSRAAGLRLSSALGERFSTNGDQIAAIFRHRPPAQACRDEDRDPAPPPGSAEARQLNIGPTICGLVRAATPAGPIAVEEFAVPAPLRHVMGEVITSFGLLHQALGSWESLGRHAADAARDHDPLAVSQASLAYSSVIGMMGDDGAGGVLELVAPARRERVHDAGLRVVWAKKGEALGRLFDAQLAWLGNAAHAIGGTVVPAPTWQLLPRAFPLPGTTSAAVTVHPLGGCAMADDETGGVVDADGCVFDPAGGVHPGLAVLDGAIVPRALAINPALTITALAERALPELLRRWQLAPRDAAAPLHALPLPLVAAPPRWQPQPPAARRTRFRVREQMHGLLQVGGRALYAQLEVPAMDIADLGGLLPRAGRRTPLAGAEAGRRRRATLRLYEPLVREELLNEDPDDGPMPPRQALAELDLGGTLGLFLPQRPGFFEAAGSVLRGARLIWERRGLGVASEQPAAGGARPVPLWRRLLAIARALLTLTRWRQLVYRMDVRSVRVNAENLSLGPLQPGGGLLGIKTLGLVAGGNPWQQIGTLALHATAADGARGPLLGTLTSDLDYFVRHRQLLGQLTAQRDQPGAQADLASMLLLTLRVFLFTHWPQFLPPGDTRPRVGERRVNRPDADPVPAMPVELRGGALLHRYAAPGDVGRRRPMLLIHGLSAAGSTFVHPAIPDHLVGLLLEDGRDAWVLDLRTSSALDPPRRGPFSFELAATNDIPRAVAKVREISGAARVDVFAHCIGAAMFCMAVLQRHRAALHGQIGSVVLSQVGPYARLSPFNRLRGFVAGFLQDYLGLAELDTRPELHHDPARKDWVARTPVSGALAMADALLATFPYPADDGEQQRVRRLGRGRDFRRVRHRADGIIGHTLALDQVADETLQALDAIYGWVKTRTLAQVIHIARQGVLTHRDGNNESVSGARLAARFRFPVLLLHGERNEVFDWRGSLKSYRSLCRAFDAPIGDPVREPGGDRHWGAGTPRQFHLLHDHGHQDSVIGRRLRDRVYPVVQRFLDEGAVLAAADAASPPVRTYVCGAPWMGPMIGHVSESLDVVNVALLVHAGTRRAETVGIVLVPLAADGRSWDRDTAQARLLRARPRVVSRRGAADPQRQLLLQHRLLLRLDPAVAGVRLPLHFAVLVLYRETRHPDGRPAPDDGVDPERPVPPPGSVLLAGEGLDEPAQQAVREAMTPLLEDADAPALAAVRLTLDRRIWDARDGRTDAPAAPSLCFAAGSCQFPPALFDQHLAGAAWRRLGRLLDRGGAGAPQFMLLLGDQVYLDALGNVFQAPGRSADDTARRAYEAVWRLPALRDVARRLPLYPMLDDHEIANDWQPPPVGQPLAEADEAALAAYDRFQAKLSPPRVQPLGGSYSYHFEPGGVPCFVLDTRTKRQPRQPQAPHGAHLIDPYELPRLRKWLNEHRDAPVKIIASPSFLLPLERPELDDVEKLRLDGGSGFPATQLAILSHVRDAGIRGVVLIGGDAHLSAVTTLAIDGGPRVVAVLSSGLYAPWPFANARPADLLLDGPVVLHDGNGVRSLTGQSRCLALSTEQGMATLALQPRGGGTRLRVRLCRARGPAHDQVVDIDL